MRSPRPPLSSLDALAALCGILPSFTDSSGVQRLASPDTLRALLCALGVDAATEAQAESSLARMEAEHAERGLEPVIVAWNGRANPIRLPEQLGRVTARIAAADSAHGAGDQGVLVLRPDAGRVLAIPVLPFGYHSLELDVGGRVFTSLVISAPLRAFSRSRPRARKGALAPWGAFLPMYAASSGRSWGAGDFTDWELLCRRTRDAGGSVVGTLPLMSAFLDKWKSEPSPYSPASRLFWNEFYVDPMRSPEFDSAKPVQRLVNSPAFQREIGELQRLDVVDYDRTMALKRRVLEPLAKAFFRNDSPGRSQFEQFRAAHPQVDAYAAFRAACEREKRSWHSWPQRMREGQLLPRDYNEAVKQYYLYAQWLAHEQVAGLLRVTQAGPRLYFDLPLGVNTDGYDVWRHRDSFVLGANVGAPPDAFFTRGQDWGFPPLHPRRIRETGYRYVIDYLRFQMRHTGLLRIDHVMGLHRLWWVPHGSSAAQGAYVRYHPDEWYAILCLESHRHQTALVGENLGTVPPEVNKSMKRHGVRSMFVVQYEANADAQPALPDPPGESVASINTHDMPMWAAHWRGLDIADRRALGLLQPSAIAREARRRMRLRRGLVSFLRKRKLVKRAPGARDVLLALLKYLRRCQPDLVLVNLEDIWLETAPQNTPGTSTERVNWARKARFRLDDLFSRREVAKFFEELNRPVDD